MDRRIQIISDWFVGRRDIFARQLEDGSYRPVKRQLTEEDVRKHVEGEVTLGAYVLDKRGRTRFIAFDFDELGEQVERQVDSVAGVFKELGLDTLKEFSGRKGFHLWAPFEEPVDPEKAIGLGRAALALAEQRLGSQIDCELFPKSAKPPGPGNLIKLPWGKHQLGEFSYFVDDGWQPFSDQLEPFDVVKRATEAQVDRALSTLQPGEPPPQEPVSAAARPSHREPLQCFDRMMMGVSEGCRDVVGFALAKHLKRQGVDRAEADGQLLDWNINNRPPLPKRQVLQKIAQAYEKDYQSLDCEDQCIQQFCEPGCPLLEKRDPAKVAEMFLERARHVGGEEGRELATDTLQYIAKVPYRQVMAFRDIFRDDFGIRIKDFEKLVREAKRSAQEKAKQAAPARDRDRVRRHLWEDEPRQLRQSLDHHKGITYTIIEVIDEIVPPPSGEGENAVILDWQKNTYVITSEREMFPLTKEQLRERGLYIDEAEEAFTGSRWSKPSLRRFLEEGYEVDPAEVFRKVRDNVAFYMQFDSVAGPGFEMPPEATVDLVALLIIVSWHIPVFDAIPYQHCHGEMASGKSKLQRVQAKMSFLGYWVTQGTTTAALKRLAHQGASLFFDNVENIRSRDFDPDQRAIILSSNARGASVPLVEEVEGRKIIRHLQVFGIKGFGNIAGLDEVLASRAIRIPLVRGTDSLVLNRDPDGTPPPHPWHEVVDDLYVLAMTATAVVKEAYGSVSKEGFEGREWQLWRPVFALASVIDGCDPALGLEREMEQLAIAKRYEDQQAGEREDAYWILLALVKEVFLEGRTGPIPNHEVLEKAEALNPDLLTENAFGSPHHLVSPTALGQIIKRLRVTRGSRRKVDGRTAWVYNARKLEARAHSYGIDIPALQRPLPNSDTPEGSEE